MRSIEKAIAIAMIVLALGALAQTANVRIDEIISNKYITGAVEGLSQTSDYKVLVYVQTDQWYIHPYAGQGEGVSWARVQENGGWRLPTVKRGFAANRVAALVVSKDFDPPARTGNIRSIPAIAIDVKDLLDTPSYGDL